MHALEVRQGRSFSPLKFSAQRRVRDDSSTHRGKSDTCERQDVGIRFRVVMTAYNAAQWIDKPILSLKHQRYLSVCAFHSRGLSVGHCVPASVFLGPSFSRRGSTLKRAHAGIAAGRA